MSKPALANSSSRQSKEQSHAARYSPSLSGTAVVDRGYAANRKRLSYSRQTDRVAAFGAPPLAIALIDEHEFTRGCIATCLRMLYTNVVVTTFTTAEDCIAARSPGFNLVFYHARGFVKESDGGVSVLAKLKQGLDPTPDLVVANDVNDDTLLKDLTAGARRYCSTLGVSLDLASELLRLVPAEGACAPVSETIIQTEGKWPDPAANVFHGHFTPQQMVVLGHLQRGSANKIIAHELALSEGTVKVHIRNIMKKMKATNRTQAVFRAYSLVADEFPSSQQGAERVIGAKPRARAIRLAGSG